jgi:hypothetical protein
MAEDINVVCGSDEINVTIEQGGNPYWGQILGDIDLQEDLQEMKQDGLDALSLKVTGPSSSINNAIPVFNLTTGKIIKDSGLISVDDKIYQEGYPDTYIKFNNGSIEIWVGGEIQASWD